jgi:hypothetical protein
MIVVRERRKRGEGAEGEELTIGFFCIQFCLQTFRSLLIEERNKPKSEKGKKQKERKKERKKEGERR